MTLSSSSQAAPIVTHANSAYAGSIVLQNLSHLEPSLEATRFLQNPFSARNPDGGPGGPFVGSRAPIEAVEPSITPLAP